MGGAADSTPAKLWFDFEVNVIHPVRVTPDFVKPHGTKRPGFIFSLWTGLATSMSCILSSYSLSKM